MAGEENLDEKVASNNAPFQVQLFLCFLIKMMIIK